VNVHAGTVVANDGLRHEGGGLAVLMGNIVHHVLQDLGLVGTLDQGVEHGTDFALTGSGDFVVMNFNRAAEGFEGQHHGRTDVVQAVDRGNREVAALDGRTVAGGAAAFALLAGGPGSFGRVDLQGAAGHVDIPFDGVEDEEFGFRAEVGGVADTGGLQIGFGALGDRAWVAVVAAAVRRIDDVTGQDDGGFVEERVDVGGVRIRVQLHVGSLNALPAGNGGAVKSVAIFELVFAEGGNRHGDVLFLATGIGKTEVDEFCVVFLDQLHHVLRGCHMRQSPKKTSCRPNRRHSKNCNA